MAITDKKIGSWTNPVVNEADQPQRTAAEMKAIFDSNSNQIKTAFNAVVDELVGEGGAGNVGNGALGEIPAGTVAAQLAALLNMLGSYPSSSDIKGIRLSADNKIEVTLDGATWQPTVQTGDPVTDLGALPVAADIQDTDGFLMYDASEMENKRTLWSKIKSVLGNAFAEAGHTHTPSSLGAAASTSKLTPAGGTASLTLADNTEYRFTSAVTSLTLTFPSGNFDCWLKFTTGSSITVNFPSGTKYVGGAPTFEASKTYEMSIKDGSVICAEVTTE